MDYSDVTTTDLHLAYRVVAVIAERERENEVTGGVFRAAEELLRIAYRARTENDPLPGQATLL